MSRIIRRFELFKLIIYLQGSDTSKLIVLIIPIKILVKFNLKKKNLYFVPVCFWLLSYS
jgi:hypothetical protein